jgi:hypothetical protein
MKGPNFCPPVHVDFCNRNWKFERNYFFRMMQYVKIAFSLPLIELRNSFEVYFEADKTVCKSRISRHNINNVQGHCSWFSALSYKKTYSNNISVNMWFWQYTKLVGILSIGLWRWYINITITVLDIIRHPVFYLKHIVFGDWILSPSSSLTYSDGPLERASLCLALWRHSILWSIVFLNKGQDDGWRKIVLVKWYFIFM